MTEDIDRTDRAILALLQENARISNAEIGRRVDLATSTVHQRIRKLEEQGVIDGYHCRVNSRAVGYRLAAFVRIQTSEGARFDDIAPRLKSIPEVLEVHRVVGEDCFFAKVRVRGPDELAELLDHDLQRIPGVGGTRTTIVLQTVKESTALPIERDEASEPLPV